jgi:hypothetical protein
MIRESFEKCSITSQGNLHSVLKQLLDSEEINKFSDSIRDVEPCEWW